MQSDENSRHYDTGYRLPGEAGSLSMSMDVPVEPERLSRGDLAVLFDSRSRDTLAKAEAFRTNLDRLRLLDRDASVLAERHRTSYFAALDSMTAIQTEYFRAKKVVKALVDRRPGWLSMAFKKVSYRKELAGADASVNSALDEFEEARKVAIEIRNGYEPARLERDAVVRELAAAPKEDVILGLVEEADRLAKASVAMRYLSPDTPPMSAEEALEMSDSLAWSRKLDEMTDMQPVEGYQLGLPEFTR